MQLLWLCHFKRLLRNYIFYRLLLVERQVDIFSPKSKARRSKNHS